MVLFDIGSAAWKLDEWKREIWDYARIGVPWHDRESNDAVIFGFLCGWFLAEVDNWEGSMGGGVERTSVHAFTVFLSLITMPSRLSPGIYSKV